MRGQTRLFTLAASDPSPADQAAGFGFQINWGDGSTDTVSGLTGLSVEHVFKNSGTFAAKVTARDKDNGVSQFVQRQSRRRGQTSPARRRPPSFGTQQTTPSQRARQRRGLAKALKKLHARVTKGRLKQRDTILVAVGRLKERVPKAHPFVSIRVGASYREFTYAWNIAKFKDALRRDGAYLLRSNQAGWSAQEFWETYIQLTVVERAFRVLKTNRLLRPIWHHYSGRTQAHVFICVLAYALWKTLDHLAKRAGLMTLIHKPDPRRGNAAPKPRLITPEVILRELSRIQMGDIHLQSTDARQLVLRRVAPPEGEARRILTALALELPERLPGGLLPLQRMKLLA